MPTPTTRPSPRGGAKSSARRDAIFALALWQSRGDHPTQILPNGSERAFALECARCFDAARRSFAWGFFLISLALALGSIWGNEAWGAYWQWDPKEQWSLATWLVYAALWHVPASRPWRLTLLGIGLLAIILTVTWINLSKLFPGLHSYAGL